LPKIFLLEDASPVPMALNETLGSDLLLTLCLVSQIEDLFFV